MSRLSTTNGVYDSQSRARQAARAARMNAQRQSSRDRYDARKAAQADFQRALMLQAQDANLSQQQAIMDANLRAQAAAGQLYAQQQYAKQADRSRMANDTTLRQRNRLDGIFDKRQQMDLAWNQNQIATQQAALQHALDARMRRLDHASQMARDKQQHAYGQEDARLQNTFNRDLAALQHKNNLGMAEVEQGYNQSNARLGAQLQADQIRQQHGYGQDDMRLQQQFTKDNYIQQLSDQRTAKGWTRSPALENEYQELQNAKIKAWKMYRRGELEKDDLNEQLRQISESELDLVPDVPPAKPTMEEAQGRVWEQGGAFWTYDKEGVPKVALPPAPPAKAGSGSKGNGPFDQQTGRLNYEAEKSVRDEMEKRYENYLSRNDSMAVDGSALPKAMTKDEFIREQVKYLPQAARYVFDEYMQPKRGEKDWRDPRNVSEQFTGPVQPGQVPPGFQPPVPAVHPDQPTSYAVGPHTTTTQKDNRKYEFRARTEAVSGELANLDNNLEVKRAIHHYGGEAAALRDELKAGLAKTLQYMNQGVSVIDADPALARRLRDLKAELGRMAQQPRQTFTPGF